MTIRTDVDELISWYAANSPTVHLIAVNATANTLRKFCKRRDGRKGGPLVYRDHVIEPVRRSLAERRAADAAEQVRQLGLRNRIAL
jgi:hypothetical protein